MRHVENTKKSVSKNYLPVIIEPWYFPFFGPVLSMLTIGKSVKKWRKNYGDNFTLYILGKHLTMVTKHTDLKQYYHASEEALSLVRAAQMILGSVYPEGQYIVEFNTVPFLHTIMTPSHLSHMLSNIESVLFDYLNTKNGQLWMENGDEIVVNLFDFMYRLVVRMNAANFTSPRISKLHADEMIELFSLLDAEKSVMNPVNNAMKKLFGFKNKTDVAWERWIEILMPDIEQSLKMIEHHIEPTDINIMYQSVKYAKEELNKRGQPFTPRLVAFLVYSSFLPAQINTYVTTAFTLLKWTQHEHDSIGQHIQEEIQKMPPMGELSLEDLDSMKYIEACIYETIRALTFSQLVLRHAGRDILLSDGQYIPEGNLVVTVWGDNENLYADPTKFDPERHLPPREENKADPYRILPFGRGKHPCTGERYAKMQIKTLIVAFSNMCKMEIMKESTNFEATINKNQLGGLSRPTKPIYVKISKKGS